MVPACLLAVASALAPAALPAPVAGAGVPPLPRLGTNLDEVTDWGTMLPFNDVFKTSRPWISGNGATGQWDDGRPLDLDANGWVRSLLPNQVARTLVLIEDTTLRVGAGRYVVTYAGSGAIQYANQVTVVSRAPGRDVVNVHSSDGGGVFINVTATSPADPLRDIRMVPEAVANGPAPAPTFSAAFLSRLGPYRVLRFMDWGRTNGSTLSRWADRPLPSHARWSTERGVPLEVMVDLCNETCSEPWINIPHLADDDYVRRAARLVHQRLAPGLRAWVEHSNETWNGIFPQADHVMRQGLAAGLSADPWQAGWHWHARRSVQIFRIFQQEFAGQRPLVRVLGGFVTVPWANEDALLFQGTHLEVDALAVAPYFGHEWGTDRVEETRAMTAAQLVAAVRAESVPSALALVSENKQVADAFGVDLVAYEGGHHLNAPQLAFGDPVHAKLFAAARSTAMGAAYGEFLDGWRARGGGTFVNFSLCGRFTPYGCWSVLEWITQPSTPREAALAARADVAPRPACVACPADLDHDGTVGGADLDAMLRSWGAAAPGAPADLDGSGKVDGKDVGLLLGAFGGCG